MGTIYSFLYDVVKTEYIDVLEDSRFSKLRTKEFLLNRLDSELTEKNQKILDKLIKDTSINLFRGEITGDFTGTYISVKIESGYGDCSGKICNMPNTAIVQGI